MNIAVFIKKTTFHSGYGGLETQNKALCEGLAGRGHSVTVLSPKLDVIKESETLNGVKYEFVDAQFRSLGGFAFWNKNNWVNKSVARFRVLHEREKFDVVLGQSSAALGIIRWKNILGIKVVSISHGTAAGEIKTRLQNIRGIESWIKLIPDLLYFIVNFFRRQREFVLNSDRVIAVSNAVKRELVDETFVPEKKVEVVYNGIVPPASAGEEEKTIDVLYVGQVTVAKGMHDLVEAFGAKNIRVGIVGEGDFLGDMQSLAGKNFEFFGKLGSDEVFKLMRQSSIFVLPSRRWEGMPMTLIEAAFMGLPAVATGMGGIPEVVKDEKTGFLYEVGNIPQLQERVSRLLSEEDLITQMGLVAREFAHKNFTLDKMLDGYEKILQEILE